MRLARALLLVQLFFASPIFAGTLRAATVKVTSGFIDGSLTFRGSGLAVSQSGQGYVLTSDHVLLHDNDHKQHRIIFDDGTTLPAEFVTADAGHGLALLKITGAADLGDFFALEDWQTSNAKPGDPVLMMGFPAMADGLVRDGGGRITALDRPATALIEVAQMVEVTGGHAEFGMSGGVVADTHGGFLGILAYQTYLPDSAAIHNTILAVPGLLVRTWLRAVLSGQSPVTLVQSTSQLMDHTDLDLSSGTLNFYYADPYSNGRKMVVILPSSVRVSATYEATTGSLGDFERFLTQHSDCQIQVYGFRKRDEPGSYGGGSGGWLATMRAFADPSVEPVDQLWCDDSDDAKPKLEKAVKALETFVITVRGDRDPRYSDLASDLERLLRLMDDGRAFTAVKPKDLQSWLSDPKWKSAWRGLESTGRATELLRMFKEVVEALTVLTI